MSLADTLERAATALSKDADDIRPANGDPIQLLSLLDGAARGRVLGWLLTNEPEFGEELAVAWAEEAQGEETLVALDASSLPKAGRKGLRRALHRLRSRGVEVAKDAGRDPVVARLPAIEDEIAMGFVSSLDPRGTRLAYLVESNPSGGARLFEVLIDDVRGIVDFELYVAGRSKVREFVKRMRTRPGLTVVAADPAAVRTLITRAESRQPADRPAPKSFVEWRLHLARDTAAQTPGQATLASIQGKPEPASLARVVELVRAGELGPWPPATARLQELGELVREQTESKLIVSGAASSDRLEQAVRLAAADLFDGDFAEATAIRFEESAYVLAESDRQGDAGACAAATRAFRDMPVAENPVAEALLEECLGSFLKSLRNKDQSETEGTEGNTETKTEADGAGGGDDQPLIVES